MAKETFTIERENVPRDHATNKKRKKKKKEPSCN
jgi:hypothetical protein